MAKFNINGYDSYSGCDMIVTARFNSMTESKNKLKEKTYTLGSLQTLSISTHQDRQPVRVIGSVNALDYVMGPRTIAGSLVFAVFDKHFATEMFEDLKEATGRTFLLPDELPGLDLTITFANEYGKVSRMAIYGVRLINEGQVMSINDLYTENTYQFVATSLEPLKKGIKIGSSSAVNNNIAIASSYSNDTISVASLGENIYNLSETNVDKNISRVSLTVSVEQPTLYNQEGIALLYWSPSKTTGSIAIYDKKQDKIILEIPAISNTSQYSVYLQPSDYTAWYQDNNQILSNTVTFNINKCSNLTYSYDDTPVIEDLTDSYILGLSNNISHDRAVCIELDTSQTQEVEIKSRYFKFTNLSPNTKYSIYTKSDNNISKTVIAKTLEEDNTNLNMYKDYVYNNRLLLSKDYSTYENLINNLNDNDFLYALSRDTSSESKELLYMAVKYTNEVNAIINSANCKNMPTKKIDSVYGNCFEFKTGVTKANIFLNKNKKHYFEKSEPYPTEIEYIGKNNNLYNVVSINDEFIKSPKYTFYSFSDNDKALIKQQFGNINVLNNIELKPISNSKMSNEELLCLTAKTNKYKDISLLKAPYGIITEDSDLIAYINYIDILGAKGFKYYLCISKLEECLDKTPFRKILFNPSNDNIILSNFVTGIDKDNIFAMWIEDEQFNVISELGFVSYLNNLYNYKTYAIEQEVQTIIKKIETNLNNKNYLSGIYNSINYESLEEKEIFVQLALMFINEKNIDYFSTIYELYKIRFNNICVNKDKFKKVKYDKNNKMLVFDNEYNDAELIHIALKKDDYNYNVINDNKVIIDTSNEINIYYLISSNPVIKSGFVIVNNTNIKSHMINLEVI